MMIITLPEADEKCTIEQTIRQGTLRTKRLNWGGRRDAHGLTNISRTRSEAQIVLEAKKTIYKYLLGSAFGKCIWIDSVLRRGGE